MDDIQTNNKKEIIRDKRPINDLDRVKSNAIRSDSLLEKFTNNHSHKPFQAKAG